MPGLFPQGGGEGCPHLLVPHWALLVQEETGDKAIPSFLTACSALDSLDLFLRQVANKATVKTNYHRFMT